MISVRELSGILSDSAKWQSTWEALGNADCDIQHLRVYHNTPDQLKVTCSRLACNTSVMTLDIGVAEGEGCAALAEYLAATQCVQTLTIQCLGASVCDTAAFKSGLQANCSIKQLTTHNLQPSAVLALSQALAAGGCNRQLQQLKLQGARLDAAASAVLQQAILAQPNLTLLSLQSACFVNITPNSTPNSTTASAGDNSCPTQQLFTSALARHPALTRLELQQSTGLNPAALGGYLATAVSSPESGLQAVFLDSIGLGDTGAQQLAAAAATAAHSVATAHICTEDSASFGRPVYCNSASAAAGLTELSLSSNSIGTDGARALGCLLGSLAGLKHLKVLNLSQNVLGAEGVAALAEGVVAGGSCCLQELNLESNSIKGVEGLVALLSSPAGASLTTLNLSSNCIADEAACQLAAAVAASCCSSNPALQHIDLSSNWIKDDGAFGLAKLVERHRNLVSLGLRKNRIGCKGIDALILAAFANHGLQQLSLDGNRVRDHRTKLDIEGLDRALASRRQGGGSSRRVSTASPAGSDSSRAISEAGSGATGLTSPVSVAKSCRNSGESGSTSPGSPRAKQGYEQRVAMSASSSPDASASVTAAGRAAKVARLQIDIGVEHIETSGDDTPDAVCYTLEMSSSPKAVGSPRRVSDVCPPSPFASQAQNTASWDDSPSKFPAAVEVRQLGTGQPGVTAQLSARSAGVPDAAAEGVADMDYEYSLAGFAGATSGQQSVATRTGGLGVLGSGVSSAGGSGLAGLGDFFLPSGFVQKLRTKGSRSYSFDFWNSTNSSNAVSADTRDSSSNGIVVAAQGSGLQSQQDSLVAVDSLGLSLQGSLFRSGSVGLGVASLSVELFLEPKSQQPSKGQPLGLASSAFGSVDSLSGWMLDDAFTGQVLLSGMWASNSLSGASSLVGDLEGLATVSNSISNYSCSGEGDVRGVLSSAGPAGAGSNRN